MKDEIVKGLLDIVSKLTSMITGGDSDKKPTTNVDIVKSLDEEQRLAFFVVLEPDVVDLHEDTYTAEEVAKACWNFNVHCRKANIFHQVETQTATIIESYTLPCDLQLENGEFVSKGTWVQWWYFPEDNPVSDLLWQGVKAGDINGVSIGAYADVEELQ